jgi:redox-sensitive bicupin YhaK (pirin superfamily)
MQENKAFIKKGIVGTGMFVDADAPKDTMKNDIEELKELETMDANQITEQATAINPNVVMHKAASRGHANHGWLDSYHSFSFANYYNPDRMHFGVLRVLNDDRVDAGMGFGTHPHDNMEIISIPLEGDLEHKDSMGNTAVIKHGDIQAMSAGTGIFHSEYNKNKDQLTKFLQIWVFPNKKNVTPRYDQITLNTEDRHNRLQQILSPNADDEGVWIHQNAWFHLGKFDKDVETTYNIKSKGNGVYAFLLSGDMTIDGHEIHTRDGIGIWDTDQIQLRSQTAGSEILLMEVPMSIS